jgi:hypothetical protein
VKSSKNKILLFHRVSLMLKEEKREREKERKREREKERKREREKERKREREKERWNI